MISIIVKVMWLLVISLGFLVAKAPAQSDQWSKSQVGKGAVGRFKIR